MCAIRRQYSGEVKYCWPVSCWAVLTSQRRNSAFRRPFALPRHAPGHQRLRIDLLPALELRRDVDIGNALDVGGLIDRREQPAALEIVGDDLGHAGADLGIGGRTRHEIRNRDRQRGDVAAGHRDARLSERMTGAAKNQAGRRQPGQELTTIHAQHCIGRLVLT